MAVVLEGGVSCDLRLRQAGAHTGSGLETSMYRVKY